MYMAQLSLPRAPIELTHMQFVYPHLTAADSKSRPVCLVYRFFMTQLLFRERIKFMIVHLWNWYIWTSFLYFCLWSDDLTCDIWLSSALFEKNHNEVYQHIILGQCGSFTYVKGNWFADHQPLVLLNCRNLQHCVKCSTKLKRSWFQFMNLSDFAKWWPTWIYEWNQGGETRHQVTVAFILQYFNTRKCIS